MKARAVGVKRTSKVVIVFSEKMILGKLNLAVTFSPRSFPSQSVGSKRANELTQLCSMLIEAFEHHNLRSRKQKFFSLLSLKVKSKETVLVSSAHDVPGRSTRATFVRKMKESTEGGVAKEK